VSRKPVVCLVSGPSSNHTFTTPSKGARYDTDQNSAYDVTSTRRPCHPVVNNELTDCPT